jgi:hypothetical protein
VRVLRRLQLGVEALYRVDTRLEIDAFVIDDEQRRRAGVRRAPREQLLVKQEDGELAIGLFVDGGVLENLERNDPARALDDTNFGDFCLAVEAVSHFVYLALCAGEHRLVSALELELQAEIDKFVCCLLVAWGPDGLCSAGTIAGGMGPFEGPMSETAAAGLRRRLYHDVEFDADLDAEERDRYRTANHEAGRYTAALEQRFVARDRMAAMLAELRRFYRLDLGAKLDAISRAAS